MTQKQKKSMIKIITNNPESKMHWKMNPNKNYLGSQDLLDGKDIILTIASVKWEIITNPRKSEENNNTFQASTEEKRVIRFVETPENKVWLKPWIVNETNAERIMKVTNTKFMEDAIGKKIQIGIEEVKVKKELMDGLRVRNILSSTLAQNGITQLQEKELLTLLSSCKGITVDAILNAYKVATLTDIPVSLFDKIKNRILLKIEEEKNNVN